MYRVEFEKDVKAEHEACEGLELKQEARVSKRTLVVLGSLYVTLFIISLNL